MNINNLGFVLNLYINNIFISKDIWDPIKNLLHVTAVSKFLKLL